MGFGLLFIVGSFQSVLLVPHLLNSLTLYEGLALFTCRMLVHESDVRPSS